MLLPVPVLCPSFTSASSMSFISTSLNDLPLSLAFDASGAWGAALAVAEALATGAALAVGAVGAGSFFSSQPNAHSINIAPIAYFMVWQSSERGSNPLGFVPRCRPREQPCERHGRSSSGDFARGIRAQTHLLVEDPLCLRALGGDRLGAPCYAPSLPRDPYRHRLLDPRRLSHPRLGGDRARCGARQPQP